MGKQPIHPLRAWRLGRGFNLGDAAACIGTVRQTWLDWETGRRIPGQLYMTRIYRVTGGTVTANDFYWPQNLPRLSGDDPDDGGGGERDDPRGTQELAA